MNDHYCDFVKETIALQSWISKVLEFECFVTVVISLLSIAVYFVSSILLCKYFDIWRRIYPMWSPSSFHFPIHIFIHSNKLYFVTFKGALSGLRQFLGTKSTFKMMKKAFYFTLKALFVLKIFKFLSWHFGHIQKRLD